MQCIHSGPCSPSCCCQGSRGRSSLTQTCPGACTPRQTLRWLCTFAARDRQTDDNTRSSAGGWVRAHMRLPFDTGNRPEFIALVSTYTHVCTYKYCMHVCTCKYCLSIVCTCKYCMHVYTCRYCTIYVRMYCSVQYVHTYIVGMLYSDITIIHTVHT